MNELPWTDPETGTKHQLYGKVDRDGKTLTIHLSRRRCRTWDIANETLIHEYTHCILWGMASVELHPKNAEHDLAFDAKDREIYRRFQSGGGAEESYGYPY